MIVYGDDVTLRAVLVVLSADLLFLLPVVLICCVIMRSGWKLYDLSIGKEEYFTEVKDIADAFHRRNGRGLSDDRGVALIGRHCALLISIIYLCVHIPACISLVFLHRFNVISADSSGVMTAALIGLAAGSGVTVLAGASIRKLHRSMEPQFAFAAAIRSWTEEEYQDKTERQDVLRLVFHLSDLAGGVPEIDGLLTPESGREAVRDVLEHLDGMQTGGASWVFQLSDRERGIYNKLREDICK